MNIENAPAYIVIDGPIGVGKTTLARMLARTLDARMTLEKPQDNPFLERFYYSPKAYALAAQLSYLFQRSKMLNEMKQQHIFQQVHVSDFLFEKELIFAEMNLDDDEYDIYRQVYERLAPEMPTPDLVVYLQAPVDTLQERISKRNISYEQSIQDSYLQELSDVYTRYFLRYNDTPLLVVNTENVSFTDNEIEYVALVKEILSIKKGRHFFNPMA